MILLMSVIITTMRRVFNSGSWAVYFKRLCPFTTLNAPPRSINSPSPLNITSDDTVDDSFVLVCAAIIHGLRCIVY